MTLLVTVILVLGVTVAYIFLINLYTILFEITGLTKEKAKFQVISLLTNCGYTTKECEEILSTKMRRRIALATMLTGNFFSILIVSLFVNIISSFSKEQLFDYNIYFIIAFSVFFGLFIISKLPFVNRFLEKIIFVFGHHLLHDKNNNDIILIDSFGLNSILSITINNLPKVFTDKPLYEVSKYLNFRFSILIIERNGKNIIINKDSIIQKHDKIICFGDYLAIKDLFTQGEIEDLSKVPLDENTFEIQSTNNGNAIVHVTLNHVPENYKDKTLKELNFRDDGLNILYITKDNNVLSANKDTILEKETTITIFGNYQKIKNYFTFSE